jgi:trimethylamine---corrinoid protein Co-methyltransferase
VTLRRGVSFLSDVEIDRIVDAAMRILEKTGIVVESEDILRRLAEFGGNVDQGARRARFPAPFIRAFIEDSDRRRDDADGVSFTASAEIYQGWFLDPLDGDYKEWNEARFLDYVHLAKSLPNLDGISMLGCPLAEVPARLQPLYERLYCWKYGVVSSGSIWDTELRDPLFEMCEVMAEASGKSLSEVFSATVYLISPLKFARVEAEQFMHFQRRGIEIAVGAMATLGGTAPVTLAGALALQLAEKLFISVLKRAFFGRRTLDLGSSLSVIDMATGAMQYGRPEEIIASPAFAQIARRLGAGMSGHGGLSDAKLPGSQAASQKVASAVFNALGCGRGHIAAGLLGVDEVFSPVQMILDDEATGWLKRVATGFEADDESLALDAIDETGPGGSFLESAHTAAHFMDALWMPHLWSREMLASWRAGGSKSEIDLAREEYRAYVGAGAFMEPEISASTESRLMAVISRCGGRV